MKLSEEELESIRSKIHWYEKETARLEKLIKDPHQVSIHSF